jgi:hypothetical protein
VTLPPRHPDAESIAAILDALSHGLADPADPTSLHPHLRGVGGIQLATALRSYSVAPSELLSARQALARSAAPHADRLGWPELADLMRTAIHQPELDLPPVLYLLLDEALRHVRSNEDWTALNNLLARASAVMTLVAGSGPIQ